jgi:hypothetical protein
MAVTTTWLNARLMGLNPVFPDVSMYNYSSRLYFQGESKDDKPIDLASDMMSFDILPLGTGKPVGIKDLVSLRKNEEGFSAVRNAVTECQQRLKSALTAQATQEDARVLCKETINNYRADYGGKSWKVVEFLEKNVVAGTILSIAVGASMIPTAGISAAIGVLVPALLSPAIAKIAISKGNPAGRALTHLQSLL